MTTRDKFINLWHRSTDFVFEGADLTGFTQLSRGGLSGYVLRLPKYGISSQRLAKTFAPQFVQRLQVALGVKNKKVTFSSRDSKAGPGAIVVNLAPVVDEDIENYYERLDIVGGFMAHEAAHHYYTPFEKQGKLLGEMAKTESPIHATVMRTLINIVEDERIEQKLIDSRPGVAGYIRAAKRYVFANSVFQAVDEDTAKGKLLNFINTLILAVRYPPRCEDEYLERYAAEFDQIADILKDPLDTFDDVVERCRKIKDIMEFLLPPPDEDKEQNSDCDSDADCDNPQQGKKGKKKEEGKNDKNKKSDSDDDDEGEKSDGKGGQDDKDDEKEGGGGDSEKDRDEDEGDGEDKKDKKKKGKSKKDEEDEGDSDDGEDEQENSGGDGDESETDAQDEKDDDDGSEKDAGTDETDADGDDKDEDGDEKDDSGEGDEGDEDSDEKEDDPEGEADGEEPEKDEPEEPTDEYHENTWDREDEPEISVEEAVEALQELLEALQQSNDTDAGDKMGVQAGAQQEANVVASAANHDFGTQSQEHPPVLQLNMRDAEGDRELYQRYFQNVQIHAARLRGHLRQLIRKQQVSLVDLEGEFDTDQIGEWIAGSKRVFKQEYQLTSNGAVVGFLGDESGSMDGYEERVREMAIMLEYALRSMPNIPFYCYGHTTGYNSSGINDYSGDGYYETVLNVYMENESKNPYGLTLIDSYAGNRDGHAIIESVLRMRKRHPDEHIILFVLSDGAPSAAGYRMNPMDYAAHCVKVCETQLNATVIGIGVAPGVPLARIYKHYVDFGSMSDVVSKIGNLTIKVMQDNIKTSMTRI